MISRRMFLGASAAATAVLAFGVSRADTGALLSGDIPATTNPASSVTAGARSEMRPLGRSGIEISPLVLGTNVFGWTADRARSFEIMDRFVDAGLQAVDTANIYSAWAEGNSGGESESFIGDWIASRKKRDALVVITKVGMNMNGRKGLSPANIEREVEDSLRRLRTDYIDVYFSHEPDPQTPHEETLEAYDRLIRAGKVRTLGASNYDAVQLQQAMDAAATNSLPRYEVLQPRYNLYDRGGLEGSVLDLAIAQDLGVITYSSLASGFLTGKYRSEADLSQSQRGGSISRYLNERGLRILAALDEVAGQHNAELAEVSLAWVIAREGVTAPIASSTSIEQLDSQLRAFALQLTAEELALLDQASAV